MRIKLLTAAVAVVQIATAHPLGQIHGLFRRGDEPCKQIRDHVAKWVKDNNIVPRNLTEIQIHLLPSVPAAPLRPSLALACLKSVPLHRHTALQQLDFLRPLVEWQSTLDYLRDPPQGYLSEGVDLTRGLDDIAEKLNKKKGGYANEFDYLADLYTLMSIRPRDVHWQYSTLLMDLFTFSMGAQFVVISKDRLSPPEVYLHGDAHHTQHGYKPSPVLTIDGVPAIEFLLRASVYNGISHDPDARFNGLVRSVANDANIAYALPSAFALGLADTTTVRCRNGTKLEFTNTAFVRGNFTNITSGEELYQQYGQGNGSATQPIPWATHLTVERNFTGNLVGYPEPKTVTKIRAVAGFLPDEPELSDTAILSVGSFVDTISPTIIDPDSASDGFFTSTYEEFHNVTIGLLAAAKAANRTKLILDLQGNGGGIILNVAMLYFSLFPGNTLPFLSQIRTHPQLAHLAPQWWDQVARTPTFPLFDAIHPNGTAWSSFEQYYGPYPDPTNRGAYTHPSLSNVSLSLQGFTFTQPWSTPPFKPQDVLILTDGKCASACAMLVSTLVHTHGIRTVALGGRPLEAPMQAIGMTKGNAVLPFSWMPAFNRSDLPEGVEFPPPGGTGTRYNPPLRISTVDLLGWGNGVSFNAANWLPFTKESVEKRGGVPLQFRYEAANCKLFPTWEMARDITAVWKAAAGVAWRKKRCIAGSTVNRDGTMGAGVPGYSKRVEVRYRLGKEPGALGRK